MDWTQCCLISVCDCNSSGSQILSPHKLQFAPGEVGYQHTLHVGEPEKVPIVGARWRHVATQHDLGPFLVPKKAGKLPYPGSTLGLKKVKVGKRGLRNLLPMATYLRVGTTSTQVWWACKPHQILMSTKGKGSPTTHILMSAL